MENKQDVQSQWMLFSYRATYFKLPFLFKDFLKILSSIVNFCNNIIIPV